MQVTILTTFIKLPFAFKTFVLSIFEWPLKTGFTVQFLTIMTAFFVTESFSCDVSWTCDAILVLAC